MTQFEFKQTGDNRFKVGGKLDFETVPELLEQTLVYFKTGANLRIDFTDVVKANSAAMALLIEWKSLATSNDCKIAYDNIPNQIERLASVCGVEGLFKV